MQVVRITEVHNLVVSRKVADVNPGVGARDFVQRIACILKTFEDYFKKLALEGIH